MARTVTELSVYRGRYQRVIGKAVNAAGKLVPKKFLLGTDAQKAKLANARLEQLWQEVVAEHERVRDFAGRIRHPIGDTNMITGEPEVDGNPRAHRDLTGGPRWRGESLVLAEAIRKHEKVVLVPSWEDEQPEVYLHRIDLLRKDYASIEIAAADAELIGRATLQVAVESAKMQARARRLADLVRIPEPSISDDGSMLHDAIEAYAASRPTARESGRTEAANARRLKDAHPDIALSRFGMSALQKMGDYWRSRPSAKGTDKPISLYTVKNHLDTARRLVRWIERHDEYKYEPPRHWETALKVDTRRLRTPDETAKLSRGVSVWSIDELATLYRHADETVRLLILLGLNLGAAQAEICTLRIGEIHRDPGPPTVKRVRHKSGVYGEFALWPETVQAIDELLDERRGHKSPDDPVLVTPKGEPWNRQRIATRWNRLLTIVLAAQPDFRRLPFKHLRKTGAQLVRSHADGETAGVFLCHGKPVQSDLLSDVYSNRPFDRVATALEAVRRDLRPMLAAGMRGHPIT